MNSIIICSSADFYEHVNQLAAQLEERGFTVVVPYTAANMRLSGDYDVEKVKTWYKNPDEFKRKAALMRGHFNKIARGDVVLVVNDEKRGIKGYIGPNVLMEMGLAFYLRKPIYVLNSIDRTMPVYEEVMGMDSILLDGKILDLKAL